MKQPGEYPFLSLEVKRFIGEEAVDLLPIDAFGFLTRCIFRAWREGSVPAQPAALARLVGSTTKKIERLLPTISAFYEEHEGRLIFPLVEAQRERVTKLIEDNAAKGHASARKRAENKNRRAEIARKSRERKALNSGSNAAGLEVQQPYPYPSPSHRSTDPSLSPLSPAAPDPKTAEREASREISPDGKNFDLDALTRNVAAKLDTSPGASIPWTPERARNATAELERNAGKFQLTAKEVQAFIASNSPEGIQHAIGATLDGMDRARPIGEPKEYFKTCLKNYKAPIPNAKPHPVSRFDFNGTAQNIWFGLQLSPLDDRHRDALQILSRVTGFHETQQAEVARLVDKIGDSTGGKDYSTLLSEICEAVGRGVS